MTWSGDTWDTVAEGKAVTTIPGRVRVRRVSLTSYLDVEHVRQMLRLGLPHAVPSVGDKHHGHLVLPVAAHQVSETLLGGGDGGSASHQHPIDVKEEPKRVGVLRGDLGHRGGSPEDTSLSVSLLVYTLAEINREPAKSGLKMLKRCYVTH